MRYMNTFYIIGLLVGLVFGLMLAALAVRFCRGRGNWRSRYDERQKIAIGKAYRDGFWALLAAGAVAFVLYELGVFENHVDVMMVTAGFIGLEVYVVGCIMRDAYIGLNDNAKRWTIILAAAAVLNGIIVAVNIVNHTGQTVWINLIAGIFVMIALAAYFIRILMVKRSENE